MTDSLVEKLQGKSDLIVALGIVSVILIMLVPMNAFIMDILITFSISISLIILFIGMYIQKPLDFSVFPSILLITTLFRLSLNIASTRLILVHGDEGTAAAGKIIKAFGMFIIGGNYVVGAVVFFILVIINFVVITKGAGRVAEVAARFTLDAMPGKQMSIDADLNAGLIDDKTAKKRRENVEMEADFYGSMDGASKFVRGDAIAGIIIIFVNIVGGLIIGIVQKGMPAMEALSAYTILTIGEGLVSQVPSLITSTAAGIIVTRASSQKNLGTDVLDQVFTQPRAMMLASVIIMCIGMVPGVPIAPFFVLSGCTCTAGYLISKRKKESDIREAAVIAASTQREASEEKESSISPVEMFELEIGYNLISIVDDEQGGELLEKIRAMRKQVAMELGFMVPAMKLRDNLNLKSNEYSILLKGVEMGRGEMVVGSLLAMGPEEKQGEIEGIPAKEPVFGLDAFWISPEKKETCMGLGFTVVDPATIIATHLTEIVKGNAHEFITRQEVQKLIDSIVSDNPKVMEEINQNQVTLGTLQKIMQNLLREQVSVRDMVTILESVADAVTYTRDHELITEYVRQKMSRNIIKPYIRDGILGVLVFEKNLEEKIIGSIQQTEQGSQLAFDLSFSRQMLNAIGDEIKNVHTQGLPPVILMHPTVRAKMRRFLEKYNLSVTIVSHNEIPSNIKIQSLGVIKL